MSLAQLSSPQKTSLLSVKTHLWKLLFGTILLSSSGLPPLCLSAPFERELATITVPPNITIFAEIADTPSKRAQGLMGRTHLAPDHGMLFTFSELGFWTFWMKNTKIPLDIIWMDQEGRVIHVIHNVPICQRADDACPRYRSQGKALYVLEIQSGLAKKLNVLPGKKLIIRIPD